MVDMKSLAKTFDDRFMLHEKISFNKGTCTLIKISRRTLPVMVALANHSSISVLMTSIKEVARDRDILIISLF